MADTVSFYFISFDEAAAKCLGEHHSVSHFADHIKGCDPENLLRGATTEQLSTLVGVTQEGVNENICV